jgi:hypothetical protein
LTVPSRGSVGVGLKGKGTEYCITSLIRDLGRTYKRGIHLALHASVITEARVQKSCEGLHTAVREQHPDQSISTISIVVQHKLVAVVQASSQIKYCTWSGSTTPPPRVFGLVFGVSASGSRPSLKSCSAQEAVRQLKFFIHLCLLVRAICKTLSVESCQVTPKVQIFSKFS